VSNITISREFEALFNNAAIGVITVDNTGKIVLVNQYALKQFGYEEAELLDQPIEKLIPKRYAHRHERHRDGYMAHSENSRPMGMGMDLYAIKKDNSEFPVEVSLSSYSLKGAHYAIAFISDITVRKRSEEALIKLNAKLESIVKERTQVLSETVAKLEQQIREAREKDVQLRKSLEKEKELNELKSRFVSLASHEFRTPLSTILSSAYLVSKYVSGEDQPRREKHIDRIVSSVNTLTDILNDFLSVGKIEEGKIQVRMADFQLTELCNSLLNELNTILKKGQKILYHHTGSTLVWLDPSLLKHIIMNLISNAIKFSPENSQIRVTTTCGDKSVTVSVKDDGLGISKEDQEHLFERFFRGTNVTNIQGTGLGLHIVARYVELMNGRIEVLSDLDQGTEFVITFVHKTEIGYENHSADRG
jgi:PAS domain S-box-containing protein